MPAREQILLRAASRRTKIIMSKLQVEGSGRRRGCVTLDAGRLINISAFKVGFRPAACSSVTSALP